MHHHGGLVAMALGCRSEGRGVESRLWRLHFSGSEMLRPMYRAMSAHVLEPNVVEISGALYYGVSHCHRVILGRKNPEIN